MYRSHNHPPFTLDNCIMLSNRMPLAYVPKHFSFYFINSKRRFFLYFKRKQEMNQIIEIFDKQNVKYYQRKSIFPDREENEEITFHCNYKYKKKDLRWSLKPETRFREPKNKFDQHKIKKVNEQLPLFQSQQTVLMYQNKSLQIINDSNFFPIKEKQKQVIQIQAEQVTPEYVADFGEIKIKRRQVLEIINNLQLVKALFKAQRAK